MAIIGFHAAHEQIGPAQLLTVPLTVAGEQEGGTLLDLLHDGVDRLPNVSTVDVRPNRKK